MLILNRYRCLLIIALSLVIPGNYANATDLYWYLAASMSKPGMELVETFNQSNHSFKVVLISGGSGQLLSKIALAGKGDLYTPAGISYVNETRRHGLYKNHQPLIVQTPVFALSARGRQKIQNWTDLSQPGRRIGLGNPKTMALGRAYQQIKKKMLPEQAAGIDNNKVIEAINVSQLINYLKSGSIDAGLAFAATARANGLSFIEIPSACNHQEIAPLIRLTSEGNEKNSNMFIEFILNNLAVFEKYGFTRAAN